MFNRLDPCYTVGTTEDELITRCARVGAFRAWRTPSLRTCGDSEGLAMLISVICRFHDDDARVVDDQFVDFRQAVSAALDLAERHAGDKGNGLGPPKSFEVCVDGTIELSVAVGRGGLPR